MILAGHGDGFDFLTRDGEATFTAAFGAVLTAVGVRIIKAPAGRTHLPALGANVRVSRAGTGSAA